MKYLLVIAVVAVAYLLWRNARLAERRAARPKQPARGPQEIVSCAVCSLHLPRTEAVTGSDGRLFCSDEHRLTAER